MKKMITIPALFFSCLLFSQPDILDFHHNYLVVKSQSAYFMNAEGNPYECEEFKKGAVYFNEDNRPLKGLMRYNCFEDQMEFKTQKNDRIQRLINLHEIDSIVLDGKTYQYIKYKENAEVKIGFLVKLSNQGIRLYKKTSKKFREEKVVQKGYQDYQTAAFIPQHDKFFVCFEEPPLLEIPSARRKIPKFFLQHGYENKDMTRVRSDEKQLIFYTRGMEKTENTAH